MSIFRQRLSQNTLALLLSNSGGALLSFALSVLIGRALGEAGLGIYAAALAWIFPLNLVAEFGLGTLLTREVSRNLDAAHAYLRTAMIQRVCLGGFLMALVWIAAPLLSTDPLVSLGLRIASPMIVILPLYSSFTAIFRANQKMLPIAGLNLGMVIAPVSLAAWACAAGQGVLLALAINTVTSAGQLVAAWAVYRWRFYHPTRTRLTLVSVLRAAYPFAVAAVLAAAQSRLNIILLERLTDTALVGYYAAAIRFVEAGRLVPFAFFDALFPLLSSLAEAPAQLERTFRRALLGLAAFGLVFGLVVSLIAAPLILLTYGAAFLPAVDVLRILAWALLPLLLKSGRTLYWYALGRENTVNVITLLVIVLQAVVALLLIPRYGAVGAALTVLIGEGLAFVLLWFVPKIRF